MYLLGFALDLVNMFAAAIAYPLSARSYRLRLRSWPGSAMPISRPDPDHFYPAYGGWRMFGAKRLILASLLMFSVASWCVAQSATIEAMMAGVCCRLAGGLLIPVGQALVYRHFPVQERARLTSVILLVALLVPALSQQQAEDSGWSELGVVALAVYANLPLARPALLLATCWLASPTPPCFAPCA